jgi:hypothetical protein
MVHLAATFQSSGYALTQPRLLEQTQFRCQKSAIKFALERPERRSSGRFSKKQERGFVFYRWKDQRSQILDLAVEGGDQFQQAEASSGPGSFALEPAGYAASNSFRASFKLGEIHGLLLPFQLPGGRRG